MYQRRAMILRLYGCKIKVTNQTTCSVTNSNHQLIKTTPLYLTLTSTRRVDIPTQLPSKRFLFYPSPIQRMIRSATQHMEGKGVNVLVITQAEVVIRDLPSLLVNIKKARAH
jgi:hypothetical protein